jgi:[ribosomal protein S5]-alanine N-acetyltransferase
LIRTDRLDLRPLAVEDAPAVARFYAENEEHLRPWSPRRPPGFATEAHWRAVVPRMESEWLAGRNLRLFAWPHGEDRVLGTVSLSQIARGGLQQCYLGYELAAAEQGKGYAREMVRAAVAFAFDELGLHRVAANHMPHNERSARLLKDLGFEVEGRAKAYLAINGRWEDHVMTALVNDRVAPG